MKKNLLPLLLLIVINSNVLAQTGINTITPQSTLDVNGSVQTKLRYITSSGNILNDDQILFCSLASGELTLTLPNVNNLAQGRKYTIKNVNNSNEPDVKIISSGNLNNLSKNGITTNTITLVAGESIEIIRTNNTSGVIWQCLSASGKITASSATTVGDVKYSALKADHNGWYLLNGRAINTLPAKAQASATALGFTTNLPDATNRVARQASNLAIGTTGGSNSNAAVTLTQANIPRFSMTGTTSSDGSHTHTLTDATVTHHSYAGNVTLAGSGTRVPVIPTYVTVGMEAAGSHTHSVTVFSRPNSTDTATPISLATENAYFTVNTYIYLDL